jgi:hypothetical protein
MLDDLLQLGRRDEAVRALRAAGIHGVKWQRRRAHPLPKEKPQRILGRESRRGLAERLVGRSGLIFCFLSASPPESEAGEGDGETS